MLTPGNSVTPPFFLPSARTRKDCRRLFATHSKLITVWTRNRPGYHVDSMAKGDRMVLALSRSRIAGDLHLNDAQTGYFTVIGTDAMWFSQASSSLPDFAPVPDSVIL